MSVPYRLIQAFTGEPLLMNPATIGAIATMLREREGGARLFGPDIHAALEVDDPDGEIGVRSRDNIAVIRLVGVIEGRTHSMGVSALWTSEMLSEVLADDRYKAVVFDIDSPGGTSSHVPELANQIFEARDKKRMIAVASGQMCSAAYWIGAACDEVVATPSSMVGSVGVYLVHEDFTEHLKQEGITITEITAGPYKTEYAPWKELSEEAEAYAQDHVDRLYSWFVTDVARFRGTDPDAVRDGYGQGRVLMSDDAQAAGMIDRVATLEEVIDGLIEVSAVESKRKQQSRGRMRARARSAGAA